MEADADCEDLARVAEATGGVRRQVCADGACPRVVADDDMLRREGRAKVQSTCASPMALSSSSASCGMVMPQMGSSRSATTARRPCVSRIAWLLLPWPPLPVLLPRNLFVC